MLISGAALGLKMLGIWSRLKELVGIAFKWVMEHPITAWAIGVTIVATWLLMLTVPGLKEELREEKQAAKAYRERAEENYLTQLKVSQTFQKAYNDLKLEIDDETAEIKIKALADARDYINANRLRNRCSAAGPASSASDPGSTGDSPGTGGMPDLDGIVVPEDSIRICTENTVKALAGHRWAVEIEAMRERGESARGPSAGP